MKNIVYGLKDPRNDVYQYIGKSTVGDSRALQHLTKSHSPKVNEWIEELNSIWLCPIVEIIEEVEDVNDLAEKEKYYINYYLSINPNLLNIMLVDSNINKIRTNDDASDFENLVDLMPKISSILKNERLYRGLTQYKVAELIGCSVRTISSLEHNADVNINTIKKYFLVLNDIEIITKQNRERARN